MSKYDLHETIFSLVLGQKLQVKREKAGMTQATLAEVIGMSRTSITNMEAGKQGPTVYGLVQIARALGCSVQSLLPNEKDFADTAALMLEGGR